MQTAHIDETEYSHEYDVVVAPHSWPEYFFAIAKAVAMRSKDPSTQVGCVFVDPNSKRILSQGYNGFPAGVIERVERWERPTKYTYVVHAEANCICQAARHGISLVGSHVYCTMPPCDNCTKLLLSVGVKAIYYLPLKEESPSREWHAALELARQMCREAGVSCLPYTGAVPTVQ